MVKTRKDINKLSFLSINVNGLRGKTLTLHDLIYHENPDIITCQETKIDNTVLSSELFPDTFDVFRKDRNIHGVGICIAVNKRLQCIPCADLDTSGLEAVWVKVITKNHRPLFVGTVYQPPDVISAKPDNITLLSKPLELINNRHKNSPAEILITGDFNYPLIDWSQTTSAPDASGKIFLDTLNDFHLQQLVDSPTRICKTSANILDLVITSHPNNIYNLNVGREISDHCLVQFYYSTHPAAGEIPSRKVYQYDKGNFTAIRSDMLNFSSNFFNSNPSHNSVNTNWSVFKQALIHSID